MGKFWKTVGRHREVIFRAQESLNVGGRRISGFNKEQWPMMFGIVDVFKYFSSISSSSHSFVVSHLLL